MTLLRRSVWFTAYSADFTTFGTQNLLTGGDAVKVIDGREWTLFNSAQASVFGFTNGVGLVVTHNAADTDDYFNSARTSPMLFSPIPSLIGEVDFSVVRAVRLRAHFEASNLTTNFQGMRLGFEQANSLQNMSMCSRYGVSGGLSAHLDFAVSAVTIIPRSKDVVANCLEIEWRLPWTGTARYGIYDPSSGFPPKMDYVATAFGNVASGVTNGVVTPDAASAAVRAIMVFSAAGSNPAFTFTVKRFEVGLLLEQ